jgi:hypothetical protein
MSGIRKIRYEEVVPDHKTNTRDSSNSSIHGPKRIGESVCCLRISVFHPEIRLSISFSYQ